MNMNSVLQKAMLVGVLSLASSLAVASSTVPTGSVNVSGGMTPVIVNTVEITNIFDIDPSYYELVTGAYSALTTFTLMDSNPDFKTVNYELYADTETATNSYDLGGLLASWSVTDGVGGSFSYMLSASSQYVLRMATNGAISTSTQISAVPLPGAALLFGSALLGIGALRRKKQSGMAAA